MAANKRIHVITAVVILLAAVPLVMLAVQMLFLDFQEKPADASLRLPGTIDKAEIPENEPKVINRINGFMDDDRVQGPETVPIADLEPVSNLYQGVCAKVIDAFTKGPVTSFTLYCCDSSEGRIEDLMPKWAHSFIKRSGEFRLYGLEEGEYSIAIKAQGYPLFVRKGLKVPQKEEMLEFELPRGTFIEGRVLDQYGMPVSGQGVLISVELANPADKQPARRYALSASNGAFLFGGLPPGRYDLFLKSMHNPLAQVRDIYLGQGNYVHRDLVLPDLPTVKFHITDSFNAAIVSASIKLMEKNGKASFSKKTNLYGKAECCFVPPGDYVLRIYRRHYKYFINENFKILPGSGIIEVMETLMRE